MVRQADDEGEALYRRALELDPKDATTHGNVALFQQNARRDFALADEHYRRALELDLKDAWIQANLASLRLAQGQQDEGAAIAQSLWSEPANRSGRLGFRLLFLRLALALLRHQDPSLLLGQLKTLFAGGVSHVPWPLDAALSHLREQLAPEDFALMQSLAAAMGDRSQLAALEAMSRWRNVVPIPLDAPWP